MLKVVKLDSQILQISCDCAESDGSPADTKRIVFALNPKPALSVNPSDQSEAQKSSPSENDEPLRFVMKVWSAKNGYLIVQVNENVFVVYSPKGSFFGKENSLDDARGLIANHLPKPRI